MSPRSVLSWLLPPRSGGDPEFQLGPPPLDLSFGLRAYAVVRLLTAGLAAVQHAIIALVTGDAHWWWVVLLASLHAVVMTPVGTALGRRAGWMTPLVDATSILIGTLLIGEPVVIVFWAPMVLLSVIMFFGGRKAQAGLLITIGTVMMAFAAGVMGLVDSPLEVGTLRLHAVLSFLTMATIVWTYTYSLGAAIRRKDRVLADVDAARVEALRTADLRAAQLQTIFDATPVGLSLQTIDTRFIYANPRLCEILGLEAAEILENGVVSVFSPDVLERVQRAISVARREGRSFTLDYPITTPSGERRWIEHSGHPIELEDGPGLASTVVDLTSERLAAARSRRFGAALETTSDLILMWGASGTVLHTNRAFQAMWRGGDVTGCGLVEVVGDLAGVWTSMGDQDEVVPREFEIEWANGARMTASVLVMRSEDGGALSTPVVYTAAIRDIAEVVEARTQLEGLLTAKDQFIASVSHELRTPLTVVMGMAHELAHHPDEFGPDETKEIIATIADQSGDLAAMVEDLLTAARAEAGVLTVATRPIDLCAVAREALMGLSGDAVNRAEVNMCEGVMVLADPVRTRQVVRNLLTNATRHGGPNIRISVGRRGTSGLVEVCDDGEPIPHDVRTRIFEAYGRAHDRIGTPDSVGLGLTVSRRLANLMEGDVTYDHDGTWSVFSFVVPLADSDPAAAIPVRAPASGRVAAPSPE